MMRPTNVWLELAPGSGDDSESERASGPDSEPEVEPDLISDPDSTSDSGSRAAALRRYGMWKRVELTNASNVGRDSGNHFCDGAA